MYSELQASENDLSTDELFARVMEDLRTDDDSRLGAVVALHGRPTQEVIDRCLDLCSSADPYERTIGLRVLRELRHPHTDPDAVWRPVEPVVLNLGQHDEDPDVVEWAISCLGYQGSGPAALAVMLGQSAHPSWRVRFAVAAGLPGLLNPDDLDPEAMAVLLRLAEDDDPDVRSYALMGLTGDLELTETIRPLLEAHLDDPDVQIRRHVRETLDGIDS